MGHAVKVKIEVPEGTSEAARHSAECQAREAAVLDLWEKHELSIREAAEELDLSYVDFLDLLAARGLPVVQAPLNLQAIDDIERRIENP